MRVIVFSLCLIGTLINLSFSSSINEVETLNYRLNTDVDPLEYVLDLTPYFQRSVNGKKPFTYDGICTITIKTGKEKVDTITLHKEDLNILEESLTKKAKSNSSIPQKDETIKIKSHDFNKITTIYTLKLESPLVKDQLYELKFKYNANLRNDLYGLYRSSYKEGNVTKWLAATHMEPIHARKMFPCFDEPQMKATFSVIINRPAHYKPSLSNGRLVSSHMASSNLVREYFEKTPRMSTYLVAVVVSEFECRDNKLKDFSVCTRPNAVKDGEYGFDFGQKMLAKFEELFDYKYSKHFPKMTMAAIPDFSSGGMENWGLITYSDDALLYDPKKSTAKKQQEVAAVIAHELAHMWFGDLVTCDWWSHLWLNEGFARYFQHFGLVLLENSWGYDQQFTVDRVHAIFAADSLESSLALSHEVKTSKEMRESLGSITYNKGASVIRMIEHTIGNDKFIAGLRNYFKTNALKTAVPETLYAALQTAVGKENDVAKIMNGWVTQPGFPVLNVKLAADRKKIVVSQKRFLQNGPNHEDKTLWNVPLTYATDKENSDFLSTKPVAILSKESSEIELKKPADWIVLNVQQSGYYRVNYDDNGWTALATILKKSHSAVNVMNRAQIIDDALKLARYSYISYKNALNVVSYLKDEVNYVPWKAAFNNFDFILARFKPNEAPLFEEFMLKLVSHAYDYLGLKPKANDTRMDIYNRIPIANYACRLGNKQCIDDARNDYNRYKKGKYAIPSELAPTIHCSVIEHGGDEEWKFLWKKYKLSNSPAEQKVFLEALGCTKRVNLLKNYLYSILSKRVPPKDKYTALLSTLRRPVNIHFVLDFVITNHIIFDVVFEHQLATILSQIVSRSTVLRDIHRAEKFAKVNKLNIQSALEEAKMNLKWADKNLPTIKDALNQI